MPLDSGAIARTLMRTPGANADGLETTHTLLCRREAGAFQRAAKATGPGEALLVACTQESRLFLDLNAETAGAPGTDERPIHFVNLRETGGWSRDAKAATPKLAALIAAAQLPDVQPVTTVPFHSAGRCLVIGAADAVQSAAAMLRDRLAVTLLVDEAAGVDGSLAQRRDLPVFTGRVTRLRGWLGAFEVQWSSSNPIDLDLCTRCNACLDACPEGAIDFRYQIDLSRCKSHRDCVQVCDAAGAIDFNRAPLLTDERFDLVLDLRETAAFSQHQPPQGYFHVPQGVRGAAEPKRLFDAVLQLRELVGTFDKPKFFHYQHRLCAHSRNEQIGCTACIDVCSTSAISSDASRKGKAKTALAGGIVVEPHLCAGCGACTTVCPSGALTFAYPGPVDQGKRLHRLISTYARAGGQNAALLLHSEQAGARLIDDLGRAARVDRAMHGVPARVLPVAVWHTASVGIDLWLSAIAQGASQVFVLLTAEEAPEYRTALAEQMAVAQALLTGLGYAGEHFKLIEARDARDLVALDAALRCAPAQCVAQPTAIVAQADKRATLDLMIDHLSAHAPTPVDVVALPKAGAPFGAVLVDTAKCTLCLSCVGACPENALADNPERPQLKFTEKNCVQCGLCETTCPEGAITLEPRLLLADEGRARRQSRVLHEVEPFRCIRCTKPFGTLKVIENMLAKLSAHPAFQGAAAERLKMCGDCRVVDLHSNPSEVRITDVPRGTPRY
ncbi:4Fe-4S binding protein [Sphaerotilus sp.]|uniref:4Fe-4S binding protein n=1 Tax=Sphaerotilus sp. TaxID=2093942 RepID=UPI002ACE7A3C|nr:4Fe-4S binding protein [Sphaerotilus sp.]MDZ7856364.1 4Fe-4S binding protein [Sphaerotilus sp.]